MELINHFREWFGKAPADPAWAGEVMVFPLEGNPKHPEWTLCMGVQSRETGVFLGFVGRLGYGNDEHGTWVWNDGTDSARGTGRTQGRDNAVVRLLERTRQLRLT